MMVFVEYRLSFNRRRRVTNLLKSTTQLMLWLAAFVLGIQIGAAIYEMIVITPLWTGNPPQSVRDFNPVAQFAVEPLSYKIPAVGVLAAVSVGLLSLSIGRGPLRLWVVLAGSIGVALAIATVMYAFPILRNTIVHNGAGLTDPQIIEQVRAWLNWSRVRLLALVVAWISTIVALLQWREQPRTLFGSQLRWK